MHDVCDGDNQYYLPGCFRSEMETKLVGCILVLALLQSVPSSPAPSQAIESCFTNKTPAFNAALVILGAIWVYRDTNLTGSPMLNEVRELKEYPSRAVTALSKLDNGNRLIDRCRSFLEHFNNVLADPGKLALHMSRAILGVSLVDKLNADTEGPTPSLPSLAINHEGLQAADFDFSPFGMELGEFMMDDDLVAMIDRQGLSGSGYD